MNMLLRLLWIYLSAYWRKKCAPLGPCQTHFVVLPTDLDVCRHMNNGIYFSIMDLGRVDMMVRSGLWRSIREGRLAPVVTAETIRFRRPLTLFQRFYVETRVIGWDEKAFLMEQRFMRPSGRRSAPEVLAEAIIRARFLSDGIAVPASHFLALLDAENVPSPRLPEWIARWNERQAKTRDLDRTLIEEAATDEEKPQGTFDHGGIAPI